MGEVPLGREAYSGERMCLGEGEGEGYTSTGMHTATGIRTRVSAMRGRRPSPLDDSGERSTGAEASKAPGSSSIGAISSPFQRHADVAELVDAHGSGPCLRNQVEVRVLSSASVLSPPGR
jgi:hypothetical protein